MRNASQTNLIIITGPAWSGKTKFAESLIPQSTEAVWVGTGSRQDQAFSQHLDKLIARRPSHWTTLEAPHHLSAQLHKVPYKKILVIDSISQWLANVIATDSAKYSASQLADHLQNEIAVFTDTLKIPLAEQTIILVTAENGWSVAPESPLQAILRRTLGTLNQELAALSSHVYLVCSGIGLTLKS